MALAPAAFTDALLLEARETHPWLHHPLFHMIWDGKLARADRAATAEAQARGRLGAGPRGTLALLRGGWAPSRRAVVRCRGAGTGPAPPSRTRAGRRLGCRRLVSPYLMAPAVRPET